MQESFCGDKRKDISELCKMSDAVWEQGMVAAVEQDGNFEKTKKAMIRAMCALKLIEKRRKGQELINLLDLNKGLNGLVRRGSDNVG